MTFTEKSTWSEQIEKMIMINEDNANYYYYWSILLLFVAEKQTQFQTEHNIDDVLYKFNICFAKLCFCIRILHWTNPNVILILVSWVEAIARGKYQNEFSLKYPYEKVIRLSLFVITCINKSCLLETIFTKFKDIYDAKEKKNLFASCIFSTKWSCWIIFFSSSSFFSCCKILCITAQKQDIKCIRSLLKRQKPLRDF